MISCIADSLCFCFPYRIHALQDRQCVKGNFVAYRLPTFNLIVNLWHGGNVPPAAPDLVTIGNLTPGRRHITPYALGPAGAQDLANMYLLLPAGTDIRDSKGGTGDDLAEVPAGSGRFYMVRFVDDVASGFANEHRFAQLAGLGPWPVPFPAGNVPVVLAGASSCAFAVPIYRAVNYQTTLLPTSVQWYSLPNPPIPPPWPVSMTVTLPGILPCSADLKIGPCPGTGVFLLAYTSGTYATVVAVSLSNQIFFYLVESGGFGPFVIDFSCTSP